LSPAKVVEVKVEDKNTATVFVPEDQLSLAIGKDGRNVRLAAQLTGWKIDIKVTDKPVEETEGEEKSEEPEAEKKPKKAKKSKKEIIPEESEDSPAEEESGTDGEPEESEEVENTSDEKPEEIK
jgi:N utilization substance protein A